MGWLTLAKFAWRFRYPLLAILVATCAWYGVHRYGTRCRDAGDAAGAARVTEQWHKDTARRDAADAAIRAQNQAREEAARTHNDEVVNEYTQKLAAAVGSRDDYYRLLQRARSALRPEHAAEGSGASCPVAASETDIAERIDRATSGALAEARANAEQLDALIAVVKPQM